MRTACASLEFALIGGQRSRAIPGAVGTCPGCGANVRAKCGSVYAWHWSHETKDCDPWSEPEGPWHRGWKELFPAEWREIVMGPHRADLRVPGGVIELQCSTISADEIQKRELFYGRMVWVVNAEKWNLISYDEWRLRDFRKQNPRPEFLCDIKLWSKWMAAQNAVIQSHRIAPDPHFQWLWPRKSWLAAKRKIYLDRGGDELLLINKLYAEGRFITTTRIQKDVFLAGMMGTRQVSPPSAAALQQPT